MIFKIIFTCYINLILYKILYKQTMYQNSILVLFQVFCLVLFFFF